MLGALKNLWNSEKAVTGGLLVIAATVLTALGHMSIADWREYTVWIFGLYVGGKTVQGAATAIAGRAPAPSSTQTAAVVVNTPTEAQ